MEYIYPSSDQNSEVAAVAVVSVAVAFVVSISFGALMTIICVRCCHISRQQHRKCDIDICPTSTDIYDMVGSKKTVQCIVKMDINTSYGVSLSSHQTDM